MKRWPIRGCLADHGTACGQLINLTASLSADQQVAVRVENDAVGAAEGGDPVDRAGREAVRDVVIGVRDLIDVLAAIAVCIKQIPRPRGRPGLRGDPEDQKAGECGKLLGHGNISFLNAHLRDVRTGSSLGRNYANLVPIP